MKRNMIVVIAIASFFGIIASSHGISASKKVCAVVDRNSFLVGGTVDGKWVSASKISPYLSGKERYQIYWCDKRFGPERSGKLSSDYYINMTPDMEGSIAVSGTWNALPRMLQPLNEKDKNYVSAVRSALKQQGITGKISTTIRDVVSVDLEGDGTNETLISAHSSNWNPDNPLPNQYSTVLLQRYVRGKLQTIPIAINLYRANDRSYIPMFYGIEGAWDLDGNGDLEIVINYASAPFESYGTLIYGLKSGKPVFLTGIKPNLDFKVDTQ